MKFEFPLLMDDYKNVKDAEHIKNLLSKESLGITLYQNLFKIRKRTNYIYLNCKYCHAKLNFKKN